MLIQATENGSDQVANGPAAGQETGVTRVSLMSHQCRCGRGHEWKSSPTYAAQQREVPLVSHAFSYESGRGRTCFHDPRMIDTNRRVGYGQLMVMEVVGGIRTVGR